MDRRPPRIETLPEWLTPDGVERDGDNWAQVYRVNKLHWTYWRDVVFHRLRMLWWRLFRR